MPKSPPSQESNPFDYFRQEKADSPEEKDNTDRLITSLRADMLPASDATPEDETIIRKIDYKLLLGAIFGVIILVFIWIAILGPGRRLLEKNLAGIAGIGRTPTATQTPRSITVTASPVRATPTLTSSPTLKPTRTPLRVLQVTSTPNAPAITASATPASASDCREALSITLADIGKTMCVRGIVKELISNPTNFMVVFSAARGAFYWVSYDLVWTKGEVDQCYQVDGKINQIGNSPMLIFGYKNLPEVCR